MCPGACRPYRKEAGVFVRYHGRGCAYHEPYQNQYSYQYGGKRSDAVCAHPVDALAIYAKKLAVAVFEGAVEAFAEEAEHSEQGYNAGDDALTTFSNAYQSSTMKVMVAQSSTNVMMGGKLRPKLRAYFFLSTSPVAS